MGLNKLNMVNFKNKKQTTLIKCHHIKFKYDNKDPLIWIGSYYVFGKSQLKEKNQ